MSRARKFMVAAVIAAIAGVAWKLRDWLFHMWVMRRDRNDY